MDLRSLPDGLTPLERTEERRRRIEEALCVSLDFLASDQQKIGQADEKNCENMLGSVPLPVGLAGPLLVHFSDGTTTNIYLPLATTEAALVASVNRGCKAITTSGGARVNSKRVGMSRSIACRIQNAEFRMQNVSDAENEWKKIGESTSNHLKILDYTLDQKDDHLFLTIEADTDEAMGMNMVTIAAQAIGQWLEENIDGLSFITVAGNVDSDKKPSKRTKERGRGFMVDASIELSDDVITSILKSTPESLQAVAKAKLDLGSHVAEALSPNLHAANIVAALYLATGQDAAHTVEGSLTSTVVTKRKSDELRASSLELIDMSIHAPAILVGVRGGGTALPAQNQALDLLLKPDTSLHPSMQLAESVGAAILAGEISLLAAQASHTLASAHASFAR